MKLYKLLSLFFILQITFVLGQSAQCDVLDGTDSTVGLDSIITNYNTATNNQTGASLNGDSLDFIANRNNESNSKNKINTLSKSNNNEKIWDGNVDSNWYNPNNWIGNVGPPTYGDVKIEIENTERVGNSFNPVMPAITYNFSKLEISPASVVSLQSGSLNVYTLLSIKGNLSVTSTSSSISIINITGALNIYDSNSFGVYGSVNNEANSNITLDNSDVNFGTVNNYGNITLDNSNVTFGTVNNDNNIKLNNSDVTFSIVKNESIININNSSTISSNDYTNNNNTTVSENCLIEATAVYNNIGATLILKSTSIGTGSIISGSINNSGTFTAQRYIEKNIAGIDDTWHAVSSPITDATSSVFLKHYLSSHNQSTNQYSEITDSDLILNSVQGYIALLSDDASNTLNFSGTPNSNYVGGTITGTGTPTENDSWNLLGNPYTSPIDLKKLYEGNSSIEPYIYILDGVSSEGANAWKVYPTPDLDETYRYLPMGQGFFVHSKYSSGSIGFQTTYQSKQNSNVFFKKASNLYPKMFTLSAHVDKKTDKTYYVSNENSSYNFDGNFDAYKWLAWGNHPNVYIKKDGKKASIAHVPESTSVELGFEMYNNQSNVIFNIDNPEGFETIILEDKKEEKFINLLQNSYEFDYYTNGDEDRFVIHFVEQTLIEEELNLEQFNIFTSNNEIHIESIKNINNLSVTLYDINAKEIHSKKYDSFKSTIISKNLNKGIYILLLENDGKTNTTKIVISN